MRRLRRQALDEWLEEPGQRSPLEVPESVAAFRPERQRARPHDRARSAAARRDGETAPRRAKAPSAAPRPSASASTATSVRSSRPANHLAAVSAACAAVEKWM